MKKLLISLFLVLAGVLAFILLGGSDSGDDLSLTPENTNEKLYIGIYEPLTGTHAHGGNQELLGFEYAQSQRPTINVGGTEYDVEFVLADNRSELSMAADTARELTEGGVCAVLGSYGSSFSIAGGEVFAEKGIPAVAASCTSPELTADNNLYFSICYSDNFQARVLANFAWGKGMGKIAVCTQAGDIYSRRLVEIFVSEFENLGGDTVPLSFNSVQQNFEPLIEEIIDAEVDGVLFPAADTISALFISQARKERMSLPIIGGDTWDTSDLITQIAPYGKNIYFTSAFDPNSNDNTQGSAFAAKFSSWVSSSQERLELNGSSSYASAHSALAYDAYMLLTDAIKGCGSIAPGDIAEYLRTMSYEGVTGSLSFDESGNSGKTFAYIKSINPSEERFEVLRSYSSAG